MSGTTISSTTNVGIVLTSAGQLPLTITTTGSVFAAGYYASAIYCGRNVSATIASAGVISGGGYGINLHGGGSITNGSVGAPAASIKGGYDGVLAGARAPLAITNFGTIASTDLTTGDGVNIGGDGSIVNGAVTDTAALIGGYFDGVFIGGNANVHNFGTISADGTSLQLGSSSVGLYLRLGGTITNGGYLDSVASITGVDFAVEVGHAPATVKNFGTIAGTGPLARGLMLLAGGTVSNGWDRGTAAYIGAPGKNGIYCGGTIASQIANFGTIAGGKNGVDLQCGGNVTNGSRTSTKATIAGLRQGVYVEGLLPTLVANSGTIRSLGGYWGVSIYLRGTVANGGPTNPAALIAGGGGVYEGGLAHVLNYGTILATSRPGIELKAGGTVTNYGTIASTSGPAIYFGDGPSRLRVAPGASMLGGVQAGGVQAGGGPNVLELMAGARTGSIGDLGRAITNFATVTVDAGAHWTLTASNVATTLNDLGTLTVAGSVDIAGSLAPASSGQIGFAGGAALEIAAVLGTGPKIHFLGYDTLTIDSGAQIGLNVGTVNYTGPLLENFATGDAIDLKDLAFAGVVVLDYSGTSGALQIGHGGAPVETLLFQRSTLGPGSFHINADGTGGTLLMHG